MRRSSTCVLVGLAAAVGLWFLAGRTATSTGLKREAPAPGNHEQRGDLSRSYSNDVYSGAASRGPRAALAEDDVAVLATELPSSVRDQPWQTPFYCLADFNKDNKVDDEDVRLFFAVLASGHGPMASWLDLNGDGSVTGDDVAAFLEAYASGACDPAGRARLREDVCKTLAQFHEESATVTLADASVHVSGDNGFSLTADLGPDGSITEMSIQALLVVPSQLNVATLIDSTEVAPAQRLELELETLQEHSH